MANNNKLLFSFTEHLKALNRSKATIKGYTHSVSRYLSILDRDIRTVTGVDMERYVATLYAYRRENGSGYAPNTIAVKVRALKRFFEFLERSNTIFINPMEFIPEPRKRRTVPRSILSTKEMRRLLDQPNLGTRTGIRDRAVLEVFYSTGIRLSELCGLSIFDVDLQGKMLRINQGKGKKDRVVPMGRHAVRFVREYIAKVRPHFTRKNRRSRVLFVNQLGDPLSRQVVSIMVRTCGRAAGLDGKKVTAHTLRHTFASQLAKNGADITAIQKMLGHSDLKTTQSYIHGLGIELKQEHRRSHPRERDRINPAGIRPDIQGMGNRRGKRV